MSTPHVAVAAAVPGLAKPQSRMPRIPLPPIELHRLRFRRNIAWRFACIILLSGLLGVTLLVFQDKGSLSSWEKRGFNTITILLSSLLSMASGSLLGLLGNMLRWRLLASEERTPLDVGFLILLWGGRGVMNVNA